MAQQHEDLLKKFDIMYEVKNNGVHLIVEGNAGYIDYYPSTGNWKERDSLTTGFGARTLVHHITTG